MRKPNFRKWGQDLEDLLNKQNLFTGALERHLEAAYREGYNAGKGIEDPTTDKGYDAIKEWLVM